MDEKDYLARIGVAPRNAVDRAVATRRALRAFTAEPVPRELVEHILRVAARAPSGTNMQPWRVHVVTASTKAKLSAAVLAAHEAPEGHEQEFRYYPQEFFEPYQARRRKVGWDLYGLLGIGRGDKARMHAQQGRNFVFFDAPVGMIVTIDRRLEIGSWIDLGMFIENVMIAARGHGLDTCPQAAFARFHKAIRSVLPLAAEEVVVCGIALGRAVTNAPENQLVTERAPLAEFATFHD